MSLIEETIHARLIQSATLSGLLGNRVHPLVLPEKATLPAVTYQRVSTIPTVQLDGSTAFLQARFQFRSWSRSFAEAKVIASGIRSTFSGTGDMYESGSIDLYDPDSRLYSEVVDYFFVTAA